MGMNHIMSSDAKKPTSWANMPELEGSIHEIQQMHNVSAVNIEDFTQQMEIFTHTDKLDPTNIANDDTTTSENHQYNASLSLNITQTSSPHLPFT